MNAVKNSALLLALAVPFALYGVWQVHTATRLDAPAAPPNSGLTPDQLATSSAKAAAAATETRKAVEVAVQFRTPTPADKSTDPDADATVKAAAARAADLADLDKFLSRVEKPAFVGKLKPRYEEWAREQSASRQSEDAVKAWFRKPLSVTSVADADKAAAEASKLIDEYAGRSRFASKGQAAAWRLQARLGIVDALTAVANREYVAATKAKLPLDRGTNAGKAALDTLTGLKKHLALLKEELRQADEGKATLDPALRAGAEGKGAVADEYTAREALLALFAQEDLFDNPNGAEPWLTKVREQYTKTKDRAVRKLIRDKVQEFADAFVPAATWLDDKVLINDKEVPRKDVVVRYAERPGGERKKAPLSDDPTGLTEFNLADKKYADVFVFANGSEEEPAALKPTAVSRTAVAYNAARAKVADRAPPRWTPDALAALKKACEAPKDLVDQLRTPEQKGAGPAPKIATRVLGLAAGAAACPELFEPAP